MGDEDERLLTDILAIPALATGERVAARLLLHKGVALNENQRGMLVALALKRGARRPHEVPLTDASLLAALLASTVLDSFERRAFTDMQKAVAGYGALSLRQREWVQRVAAARLKIGTVPEPVTAQRSSAWDPKARKRRRRAG